LFVGSLRLKLLINGSRTLKDKRQVVRSIFDGQDGKGRPFEVIVADDGSTDDTMAALTEKTLSFSFPFDYFTQERRGPAAARNAALRRAAGRIVLF